ncbi:MAG: hypothetical protein ACOC0P_05970, partial [Planctomycetota bacterium]
LRFARGAEPSFIESQEHRRRSRALDLAEATSFAKARQDNGDVDSDADDDTDVDDERAADLRRIYGSDDEPSPLDADHEAGRPESADNDREQPATADRKQRHHDDADDDDDFDFDDDSVARIATEVRRSWMSYRVTDDAPDVERIVVIGIDGLAGAVARRLRSELGRPAEVLLSRSQVRGNVDELGPAWPLVGMALEYAEERDPLDFMHPKQPPDVAGMRRRIALGGVAAIFCLGLLGWTFAQREIQALETELATLEDEFGETYGRAWDLRRRMVRIEHLERWQSAGVSWLDHMAYIADRLPPADEVVLGGFSGSVDPEGIDEGRERTRDGVNQWEWADIRRTTTFQFDGATTERPVADRLRNRFVEDQYYLAQSVGSDSPNKDPKYRAAFGLRLFSGIDSPLSELRAAAESSGISAGDDSDAVASGPGADAPDVDTSSDEATTAAATTSADRESTSTSATGG